MINRIKTVLYTFGFVTAGSLFATALFTTVFLQSGNIGTETLWQILLVSALCSVGSLIYPDYEVTKKMAVFLTILHYVIVNVVVLGCGVWFGWFDVKNIRMVAVMILLIAVIYFVVSAIMWKRSADMAKLMNERLLEYQNRNEEEK